MLCCFTEAYRQYGHQWQIMVQTLVTAKLTSVWGAQSHSTPQHHSLTIPSMVRTGTWVATVVNVFPQMRKLGHRNIERWHERDNVVQHLTCYSSWAWWPSITFLGDLGRAIMSSGLSWFNNKKRRGAADVGHLHHAYVACMHEALHSNTITTNEETSPLPERTFGSETCSQT